MSKYYQELLDFMSGVRAISTHSHHLPDDHFEEDFGLKKLIDKTYSSWCGFELGSTDEEHEVFINSLRHRSFFFWLEKALKELYGIPEDLSADSFALFDGKVREAHEKDKGRHIRLLKEACNFDKVILDAYWGPGSDNGHPELFKSTFRIDSYMLSYDKEKTDHDDTNAFLMFGEEFESPDSVLDHIEKKLIEGKEKSVVSIKCASAYSRGVDFDLSTKERARKVFEVSREIRTEEDEKAFQDYLFHGVCELAGGLNLPFQVHTGLGLLDKTNAIRLLPAIQNHPDTKFVLFHGGYPWSDDVLGLVHYYPRQVYPDLCWLPLISPERAIAFVSESVEIVQRGAVCWGCDAWASEESYGAVLAARHILAKAFSAKIEEGYFSFSDACAYIQGILRDNAKTLYGIK